MIRRVTRWLGHPSAPFVSAGIAFVLTLPSLGTGFIVDDYVHRALFLELPPFAGDPLDMFAFVRGGPERIEELRRLALSWWSADDLKLAFWRPLTALTHILDYAAWPDAPWLMHLHSVLWYCAAVVVVGLLFVRIMGAGWPSGLATFAYAVSHTHAMPVFFLANRNALLSVFFGALTLLFHDRWRRAQGRAAAVVAPVALLLGLLSNEGAIATCGYLLAYAVFIDKSGWRSRILSLAPYAAVVIAWRVTYQILDYGAFASQAYIDPGASPVRLVAAVMTRAPMYLLAQWAFPPSDWVQLAPLWLRTKWWMAAVGFAVVLLAALSPLLKRGAVARFWFTGMLLSLIPACAVFTMDRMLLFSGIGAAALLAQFVAAVSAGDLVPATARVRLVAARALFDLFVALHTVISPIWLPLGIVTTASALHDLTDGVEALAARDDLAGKTVVLVDDILSTSMYFPMLRALSGREPIEQLLVLSPREDRYDRLWLSRPSANTLVMEIDGDYKWFLERDDAHPLTVGDTVDLPHVRVEIQQVSNGRPTKVAFQFDTSLDDESIAWFGRLEPSWRSGFPLRGRYPRIKPPAIGQTIAAP